MFECPPINCQIRWLLLHFATLTSTSILTHQSILHGSQKAKDEGEIEIQQHGRLVGRNKVIADYDTLPLNVSVPPHELTS